MRAESARAFGTSDTRFAATSSAVKPITVNPLVVPSRLFLTLPPVRLFSKHPSKCRVVGDMGGCFATVTVPSKNSVKTVCRAARETREDPHPACCKCARLDFHQAVCDESE